MNWRLLSERRRELSISVPTLARLAGVTRRLIEQLEEGRGTEEISVRTLRALAAAVGMSAAELLCEQQFDCPTPTAQADADGAVIANVLTRVGEPVTASQLAGTLRWDGARTDGAVAKAKVALAKAGLSLCAASAGMTVGPAPDEAAHTAAAEIKTLMVEVDDQALELIWNVWESGREALPQSRLSADQRRLARDLVASHVLDLHDSGYLRLHRNLHRDLAPAVRQDIPFYPGEY